MKMKMEISQEVVSLLVIMSIFLAASFVGVITFIGIGLWLGGSF